MPESNAKGFTKPSDPIKGSGSQFNVLLHGTSIFRPAEEGKFVTFLGLVKTSGFYIDGRKNENMCDVNLIFKGWLNC